LKDGDPAHKGSFNAGAINLLRAMRERIRRINGDAVITLECCERTELLDICDGGQIESGACVRCGDFAVIVDSGENPDCDLRALSGVEQTSHSRARCFASLSMTIQAAVSSSIQVMRAREGRKGELYCPCGEFALEFHGSERLY